MTDSINQSSQVAGDERALVDAAWAQFESLTSKTPDLRSPHGSMQIPGYRVLREIHRGGQGVVYQAVQESTRRKVAIKVLKEGPFANPTELARFDREVDVLSRLNHPNIVAIHDRGVTQAGQAYCVMDYIPGRSLDAYVAGLGLSPPEILGLFLQVCEAVNVAHLRGIIHRDLKPSNIRIDEDGQPHILDFGLAKLTPEPGAHVTTMTASGQFIGSLPWASPEQAEGRADLLDIRADVYSLGVVLYQLLTRSFPYSVSGRMHEVVRNIVQGSPVRPSSLRRDLDRDVEVILLKCLAKDPERRYQSAGELARDVQRYLKGEAIEARPATSIYQLRQFAHRNKVLVTSFIAVIVILSAATVVSVAFALREATALDRERLALVREITERKRANRSADEARAVANFQAQMLAGIDPQSLGVKLRADLLAKVRAAEERKGRTQVEVDARVEELEKLIAGIDLTGMARKALDENVFQRALSAIEMQFDDFPLIKARLFQTLAFTLQELGLFDAATLPQEAALEIRRTVLGEMHPDTLASMNGMGTLLRVQGKLTEAETMFRQVVDKRRLVLGGEHPDTLDSINNLARLCWTQGKLDEAETYYREALEKRRRVLGDDHADTIVSIGKTGGLLRARGKLADAEPFCREALERGRRVFGEEHQDTIIAAGNMASLLKAQGKLDEAEEYWRDALEKSRRVRGDEHPDTLTLIGNMAGLYLAQGRLLEAERYCREAMDKRRLILGEDHFNTLNSIINMGAVLQYQGRFSDAEPYFHEALETSRRVLGANHPETLTAINNMGTALRAQGKLAEAEPYYREALDKSREVLGEQHPDTLTSVMNMGGLLREMDRLSEAEPYCREAWEKHRHVLGVENPDTIMAMVNMAALLQAQQHSGEALELLGPAEPTARRLFTGGHIVRLGRFLFVLGRARIGLGEFEEAETNLSEAYDILREAQGTSERDRTDVLTCLAQLYEAWGKTEKAEEYRHILVEISAK